MPSILISAEGLSEPIKLKPWQLPFQATVTVLVPEATLASFGLVWSLDGKSWFPDADIPPGSSHTSFALYDKPVRQIALQVESISGEPIEVNCLQAGDI